MTSIKDLRKEASTLARTLELQEDSIEAVLELAEKKKIAKPDKLFKEMVPKLNRKEKYPFTFLDLGQRQYFILGDALPLGGDLAKALQEANKQLKKAKKEQEQTELTQLVAFLELLDALPVKGYGTGIAKYAKTETNEETGEEELLLAVKVSSIEVGGKVKKGTLAESVREIDYEPRTKLGELVYLYTATDDEEQEETPDVEVNGVGANDVGTNGVGANGVGANGSLPTPTPQQVKEQVQHLLGAFKQLKPQQAFKGLGLIHQMRHWIDQLDEVPAAFQKLLQQLEAQHQKLKPVLSQQIDTRFDHSMEQLDELPVIQDTSMLDDIFGTVQKLFEGWKTFVPEEPHPKQEELETVGQEIDWLKYYERIIVPMRKEHDEMEDGEEKEQLRVKINELIEEARFKIDSEN